MLTPDSGLIEVDGEPVTIPSPSAAHTLRIATVFQDLALCDNLDVTANLFLGRDSRTAACSTADAWSRPRGASCTT